MLLKLAAVAAVAGGAAGMTITDLLVNLDCILWLMLFFLVLHPTHFWDGKFSGLHEELLRTIREEDKEMNDFSGPVDKKTAKTLLKLCRETIPVML